MSETSSGRPQRLILVGLRGAGKTAAGRQTAKSKRVGFADTDDLVEQRAGMSIAEIFESRGEHSFRKLESRVLKSLSKRPTPEIIATGGGVVLSESNRRLLKNLGQVSYLKAPAEVLAQRIASAQDSVSRRPKFTALGLAEEMEQLTREREPLYLEVADVVVDADVPLAQVVNRLTELWASLMDAQAPG